MDDSRNGERPRMFQSIKHALSLLTTTGLFVVCVFPGCRPYLDRLGGETGATRHPANDNQSMIPSWLPTTPPNPLDCGISGAMEMINAWRTETPSVEGSLDRINTAARLIDIGELVVEALPISAGSMWPEQMGSSVPPAEEQRIKRQLMMQDRFYSQLNSSPLKIRAMYIQGLLFSNTPNLYFDRETVPTLPAEQDVQSLATKVLGPEDNPAFHEVFYRLLLYNPEFTPRKELFSANFQGKPSEVYVNMGKAVIALADNKEDLIQAQETVWSIGEKRVKAKRDVEEIVLQIRQQRLEEYVQWFQASEESGKSKTSPFAKRIDELEEQYEIEEQEYEALGAEYEQALAQLEIEYDRLRDDQTALEPENETLAYNIQTATEDVENLLCHAHLLGGIAGYHLRTALPRFDDEVQRLASMGQAGSSRVQKLYVNGKALPLNLKIMLADLNSLNKVTSLYDDLFEHRIKERKSGSFMDKLKQMIQ